MRELLKLGLDISQRSVARLMPRRPTPPSQTWRMFLQNHLADLVSVDFFVVPTAPPRSIVAGDELSLAGEESGERDRRSRDGLATGCGIDMHSRSSRGRRQKMVVGAPRLQP